MPAVPFPTLAPRHPKEEKVPVVTQRSKTSPQDDVVTSLQEAAIGRIAKHIFGEAILASVRKNPVLLRTLWEAFFYALTAALVGRFQFGLPLLTCFLAIFVLYAEAIVQVHYAELWDLYCKWTTFRRRFYLAAFVFAFLRFMVWKGFGIPPAEAYAALERAGGLIQVFWLGNAPAIVLMELELTIILGTLSCLIVFRKHRRAVFAAAAITAVAAMFWAMPATDQEFAERGVFGVVFGRLGRLTGATSQELEEHGVIGSAYYRARHYLFGEPRGGSTPAPPPTPKPTVAPATKHSSRPQNTSGTPDPGRDPSAAQRVIPARSRA